MPREPAAGWQCLFGVFGALRAPGTSTGGVMKAGLKRVIFTAAALILGAVSAFAQQATIAGTVTDTSGGVLPGVTITIIHEETGNTFEAVTDAQGQFRIPVRVGAHRLTATLSGFQTVTRTGLQLLLN